MKKKSKLKGMIITFCALLMVGVAGLSFTLAKYVKSIPDNSQGPASVAKFGVTMEWEADKAFQKSYKGTDGTTTVVQSAGTGETDYVIAPGTSGSVTLTFGGTASEVAFKLAIDIAEAYSNNWKTAENGTEYHPIKYEVTSTLKANDVDVTGIASNSATVAKEFAPGTTLSGTITITWEWPFEVSNANNDADLYMSGLDATYVITAKASITQIDAFTPATPGV